MINIEKEHVEFEAHCKTAGYTDKDLQKTDDYYVNLHVQTVWEGWLPCAGSKQCDIDDLKAQINALEDSRMTWREYAMKIESGEYVLISKQCPDPEFADALFDLLDQHAFGEVGQDKFISYSDIDEEKVYALVVNSTQKTKPQKCVWRENEDGIWDTACGQDYVFDGYAVQKPSDCGQYCSNCGRKIEDVSFGESEDE